MKQNIIIGSGIAGHQAAVTLRKEDPDCTITLLTADKEPTYFRPRLIDYLGGRVEFEKILIKPLTFYEEQKIEIRLETVVKSIDAAARKVILETGETLAYDQLLLAAGARSFVPPLEGKEIPGVFTFRDKDDADRIIKATESASRAVVIGGGLLGLETAQSLIDRGLEVEVVEFFDRLLPRQLDQAGADHLQSLLEKKGFSFTLGAVTESFLGTQALEGVKLKSGRTIPCDLAVVSTGVRSRLELAESAGLALDKAVVVNDRMETSQPGIFAAGDSVIHQGRFYGLWLPAKEQGDMAGKAMAGQDAAYEGTPLEARLKITGISLFSAGDFEEKPGDQVKRREQDDVYAKAVIRKGELAGAIVLGDNKAAVLTSQVFSGKKPLEALDSIFSA